MTTAMDYLNIGIEMEKYMWKSIQVKIIWGDSMKNVPPIIKQET